MTKQKAEYVDKAPNKHCIDCNMFKKPSDCTLVEGTIARHGSCKYWEKKLALPVSR